MKLTLYKEQIDSITKMEIKKIEAALLDDPACSDCYTPIEVDNVINGDIYVCKECSNLLVAVNEQFVTLNAVGGKKIR